MVEHEIDEWVPLAMAFRFEAALQAAGTRGRVELDLFARNLKRAAALEESAWVN